MRWVAGILAAWFAVAMDGTASAQRTPTATAGSPTVNVSVAANENSSSCVLMLQRPARIPGAGFASAAYGGLADIQALTTAMTTTGMIDPAAKAALGLGPRQWPKVAWIEVTPAGAQAVKLVVKVDPGPNSLKQEDPSGALVKELVKRAKAVVRDAWEPRREELKTHLEDMEKRRVELRATTEKLRGRMREAEAIEARGMIGPTQTAGAQRRQVEAELAVKRPRLNALRDVARKLRTPPDEVGNALRELVAAREAVVAGVQNAVAAARKDPLDLLRARAELAEVRVRAAEWGREASHAPGRNLADEVLNVEVEVAALESQLQALPAASAEPARAAAAEDIQQLRFELSRAESELNTLEMQYQQLRRELERFGTPPTLVVLDGQAQ
jgi:hypothetical protein